MRRVSTAGGTVTNGQGGTCRIAGRAGEFHRFRIEQVGDTEANLERVVDVPVTGQIEDVIAIGLDIRPRCIAQNEAVRTGRNPRVVFDERLLLGIAGNIDSRQVTPAQRCVIDIYQQPNLAREEQIIGTPTLIKQLPLPFRKLVGDMSDTEKVLVGLDLKPKNSSVEANK